MSVFGQFFTHVRKFCEGRVKAKYQDNGEQQQSILFIFSLAVIGLQFQPLIIYNISKELYNTSSYYYRNGKEREEAKQDARATAY